MTHYPTWNNIKYIQRTQCPGCEQPINKCMETGILSADYYFLGGYQINARVNGQPINLYTCNQCKLTFKDKVPDPDSLTELFRTTQDKIWTQAFSYRKERRLIKKLFPSEPPRLLDVGAGNGALLRSLSHEAPSRSALDLVKNPECEATVNDEYIIGSLDDSNLKWSGRQFDLVTLFDILEHAWNVKDAFENIKRLIKPSAYALMETGDAQSYLPARFGLNNWYYLNLLEHHQAFTPEAVGILSRNVGMRIIRLRHKRHKYKSLIPWWRRPRLLATSAAYHLSPSFYTRFVTWRKKYPRQPAPLLGRDHFQILLQQSEN